MIDLCRQIPIQENIEGLNICYYPKTVSQDFVDKVTSTLNTIPTQLLHIISHHGFFLILSKNLSDVHPEIQNNKPRGHDQSSKTGNTSGLCCPSKKHIHLTEYSGVKKASKRQGTLRHEIGHALDASIGSHFGIQYRDISEQFLFNQVFSKDLTKMPCSVKIELEYYIQKRSLAGRSEAFAESVASLIGGGCEEESYFKTHFRESTSWIEKHIFEVLDIPTFSTTHRANCVNRVTHSIYNMSFLEKRKRLLDNIAN